MENEKLAEAAKGGDSDALLKLWKSVRRLCFQIARRYKNMLTWTGYTDEDTEQTLFLAFCAALDAFDPSTGKKFTSYLQYPIMNALRAALGIRDGREQPPAPVSLDSPLGDEADNTMGDLIPDSRAAEAFEAAENSVWNEQLHSVLERCLADLEDKRAEAVRAAYFEGLTAEETGKRLGVSTSRAACLKKEGLRKLRQGRNLKRLEEFREAITTGLCRGTSLSVWRYSGNSIEEQAILRLEELESPQARGSYSGS